MALALAVASGVRRDLPAGPLEAKYGGGASRFVALDGVRVHYRDEGSGPPLLLIHGTASSLHTWDGWVARMSHTRRVVRLDLPGFGLTGPAADRDYRVARYARLATALLDRLGITRSDVAGNSLGGRVALTLALDHPERVRRLVLVDAAGLSGQKPPAVLRLARIPVLDELVRWVTPRFVFRQNVMAVYGDRRRIGDALVDRYYELGLRAGNRQALVDRMSRGGDPDLDARLGEVRAPTLIEWGERDAWIPLAFGRRLHAGIAGSRLVTYADGGHVPREELAERTAADAAAFLDEAP